MYTVLIIIGNSFFNIIIDIDYYFHKHPVIDIVVVHGRREGTPRLSGDTTQIYVISQSDNDANLLK